MPQYKRVKVLVGYQFMAKKYHVRQRMVSGKYGEIMEIFWLFLVESGCWPCRKNPALLGREDTMIWNIPLKGVWETMSIARI